MIKEEEKTLQEKVKEILYRLETVFTNEGLIVTINRIEGDTLYLDIERVAKGVPVTFMVKAIGGTFRRYLPAIQQTVINDFKNTCKEPEAEPKASKPLFTFNGLPELDMSGINPDNILTVLNNFAALVLRHDLHKFRITWKDRVQAAKTLPTWVKSINACMHKQGALDHKYIVHVPAVPLGPEHSIHCGMKEVGDVLPARILVTMPSEQTASENKPE